MKNKHFFRWNSIINCEVNLSIALGINIWYYYYVSIIIGVYLYIKNCKNYATLILIYFLKLSSRRANYCRRILQKNFNHLKPNHIFDIKLQHTKLFYPILKKRIRVVRWILLNLDYFTELWDVKKFIEHFTQSFIY